MGNTFGASDELNKVEVDSLYLTRSEHERVLELFAKLEFNASGFNVEQAKAIFQLENKPEFARLLTAHLLQRIKTPNDLEAFIVNITRMTSLATLQSYWDLIPGPEKENWVNYWNMVIEITSNSPNSNETVQSNTVSKLCEFLDFTSTVSGLHLDQPGQSDQHCVNGLESILNNYLPHTAKALESYMNCVCFSDLLSPSYKPFYRPILDTPSEVASMQDILPLALHSDSLQGRWKRLYSTSVDGLSFNRVVYHCLGYDGPTCILVKCQDPNNSVIGAVSHDRWKDSNRFYGSSKNVLFSLTPKLRIYRSKSMSNNAYQWLNTKSPTLPRGMGFGGTTDGFRMFIPESLEGCTTSTSCPTYETGRLVEGDQFEMHTLEIWGCGGSDTVQSALQAQAQERAATDENIRRARHVDKAQFFNNEFDREFFLSGTTSHGGKDRMGNS